MALRAKRIGCGPCQPSAQVVSPLFKSGFGDHGHGFREARNAHQEVREVESCWKDRRRNAVDCDLKSFFDTVNHFRLMERLRGRVRDRKVLALIRPYLEVRVMLPGGTIEATPRDIPQDGRSPRCSATGVVAGSSRSRGIRSNTPFIVRLIFFGKRQLGSRMARACRQGVPRPRFSRPLG
jgi:hypothetical protein